MIRIYTQSAHGITRTVGLEEQSSRPEGIFWIDLLTPNAEELAYAEQLCAIARITDNS